MNSSILFSKQATFGRKILFPIVAVILLVLSAFTLFAVARERKTVKADLNERGEMLTDLLARNSVVGVFAENKKLLTEATDGVFNVKGVTEVSLYNTELRELSSRRKGAQGTSAAVLSKERVSDLKAAQATGVLEGDEGIEFIKPIVIKSSSARDESLYFGSADAEGAEKVIGYVRITLSKDAYRKELVSIIARNAASMLVFVLASVVIVYVAVKKVTRPLEKLTQSVKAMEKGLPAEHVPVESGDEVGNLAAAFNSMVDARGRAEEEVRSYHERLVAMSSDLSLAEERERRSIASNLHDSVGQMLVAMKIKLGAARKASPPGKALDNLDEIRTLIDQSIQFTRSLTYELSPPVLYELGLVEALDVLAGQIKEQHGLAIHIEKNAWTGRELNNEMRFLLFKTVRELLFNVVKHAGARTARVSLFGDQERIRIAVEDDGAGFDAAKTGSPSGTPGGFGLFSIRERLKYLGGSFEVDSAPGKGARVFVTAPVRGPEKKWGAERWIQ